jgi:MFS family permease
MLRVDLPPTPDSIAPPCPIAPKFTTTHWLIIVIASIGFLFDTYELLMTPLVAAPAIAELLKLPMNNPIVTSWVGNLLWIAALCGGVFGLLGGWLVDKFGRKKIMAASIFLYSFSPFCAAYATSLGAMLCSSAARPSSACAWSLWRRSPGWRRFSKTRSRRRSGWASRRPLPRSAVCW